MRKKSGEEYSRWMNESVVGDIAMLKINTRSMGPLPIIRLITMEIRQHKRNRFTRYLSTSLPKKAELGPRWLPLLARNLYFLS